MGKLRKIVFIVVLLIGIILVLYYYVPTIYFNAIKSGNLSIVSFIIAIDKSILNAKDPHGQTALSHAVQDKQPRITEYLLRHGISPNEVSLGKHPLYYAVDRANDENLKLLLTYGANPNSKSTLDYLSPVWGSEPILVTAVTRKAKLSVLETLLNLGANPNMTDSYWRHSPIHIAAYNGNIQTIELLYKHGAKLSIPDRFHAIPLHYASNEIIANYLIQNGSDMLAKDNDGLTTLHYAVNDDFLSVVKALINNSINVNVVDNSGRNALHYVKSVSVAKLLLEDGINIKNRTTKISNIFDFEHNYVNMTVLDSIVLHYRRFNNINKEKEFSEIVKLLLEKGVDKNLRDAAGKTALDYAKEENEKEIVQILQKF